MKIYVFMFLCLKQKRIMSKRSSLPSVGRVARSAGRVEKLFEAKPPKSTPQSLRDSSPASGEQLTYLCQNVKTKEQKNRFLRTKFMSLCSYVKNKEFPP